MCGRRIAGFVQLGVVVVSVASGILREVFYHLIQVLTSNCLGGFAFGRDFAQNSQGPSWLTPPTISRTLDRYDPPPCRRADVTPRRRPFRRRRDVVVAAPAQKTRRAQGRRPR